MAGADASIYSMIRPQAQQPGPLDQYTQALQVKHMMGQGDLQDLQAQGLRRGMAADEQLRARFSRGDEPTVAEIMAIDPAKGLQFEKSRLENRRTTGEIEKTRIETAAKAASAWRDEVAKVAGEQDMPRLREAAMRIWGPEIGAKIVPPAFSPDWQKREILTGDKLLEQLKPHWQAVGAGGSTVMRQMNAQAPGFTDAPIPHTQTPDSIASQATTRRGQDKPVWDATRGVFITQPGASGGGAPAVITPTGVPQSPAQITSSREDADRLRQEFEGKGSVKNYRDVLPIARSAKSSPDTRAGDIQMAYAVGKILDPNSVVREGELKLVGEAATVMNKIEGELRTLAQGKGRLNPATRAELQGMLDNAVAQRKASYDAERGSFEGIVSRRGYKPEDIFIDTPSAPAAAPTATPTRAQIDAELARRGVAKGKK